MHQESFTGRGFVVFVIPIKWFGEQIFTSFASQAKFASTSGTKGSSGGFQAGLWSRRGASNFREALRASYGLHTPSKVERKLRTWALSLISCRCRTVPALGRARGSACKRPPTRSRSPTLYLAYIAPRFVREKAASRVECEVRVALVRYPIV